MPESGVQYPDVTVRLVGEDGNAFAIIGRVRSAIRDAHGSEAAKEFSEQAMSCGSYDELLALCLRDRRGPLTDVRFVPTREACGPPGKEDVDGHHHHV